MIGVGVAVALGTFIASRMQAKKNQALAPAIEAALRAQGALTLPALTEAVGLKGFSARGKVIPRSTTWWRRGRSAPSRRPTGRRSFRR